MSRSPRVSVVIPVYNGAHLLRDAVASVLSQDEPAIEIVVVDDGSTDDSAAVAAGFGDPVRVLRQPNGGPAAARNAGLAAARGEIIGFLDADDLYTPDKLALQLPRLDRHPEIDIVIGQRRYLMLEGLGDPVPRFCDHPDDHLSLQFGCGMFRRRVFDRIGVLDHTMRLAEDWDWFMRARENAVPLLLHRHVVLEQRLHAGNITRQKDLAARFTLEMMRRSLARRRAGQAAPTSLPPLSAFFEPEDGSR